MNIKNDKVNHRAFGEGTVVSVAGNRIEIDFGTRGIKTFVYPDAFEKFLQLQDPMAQVAMQHELAALQEAKKEAAEAAAAERALAQARFEAEQAAKTIGKRNVTDIDHGFGPDYHVEHLARHPVLTYQQVEDEFHIKISGFGRGINQTDHTVVLISSVDKKKADSFTTTAGIQTEIIFIPAKAEPAIKR